MTALLSVPKRNITNPVIRLLQTNRLTKAILLTIICCSISTTICAQSYDSASSEIIIYKDFKFSKSSASFKFSDYNPDKLNDNGYGIALHKRLGDRRFRQYEAIVLWNTSTYSTYELKQQAFQINYKRGKYWKKNILKKIRPRHSLSLHLDYFREDSDPLTSNDFPIERTAYGIGLDYFIGLELPIINNFNFHIDCSLLSLNFAGDYFRVKNPTLTLRQQEQGGFDFDLGGKRVLKLGLGMNF